ncbi:MAG: ribosome biogenesis GTPase YlqF, partial [Syntrophomonadaceae bacterium]|nr:ribosome biogenesis GTPase YlqF [Syntrophomonadaceae bacterium]
MTVNWFPGHMVRARREIGEQAELVDVVIEVVDARAPVSTANPDLPELVRGKPVVRVLNKADLADADATRR